MIEKAMEEEILKVIESEYLFHIEGQEVEFKEQFNLLLQVPDANRRYEVEIRLGKTDEAHS
ncbi:MAG: hypothetical protein H6571_21915 [Lewinellaceae bacterium]|nr:hypothetical protein [Lewinellaceae bacterium]